MTRAFIETTETIKLISRVIVPIILLLAGVAVLFLHLPVWSLLIGFPLTVIGTIFLIYTYDEVLIKTPKNGDSLQEEGE